MGAMKAIYMDMAEDFENLNETSMQFKGNNWEAQDGRFEGPVNYELDYIYSKKGVAIKINRIAIISDARQMETNQELNSPVVLLENYQLPLSNSPTEKMLTLYMSDTERNLYGQR